MENSNVNGNNANRELNRFRQILIKKINEKKNQISPLHSSAYNNSLQHEMRSLRWVLGLTTVNQRQMQMSQIEDIIQKEINKLDTTLRTKSLSIQKRDKFIMYYEILQWILYVIRSIEEKGLHWKLTI